VCVCVASLSLTQTTHWKAGHKQWCKEPLETHLHSVRIVDLYVMIKNAMQELDLTRPAGNQWWDVTSLGCGSAAAEYALLVEHQKSERDKERKTYLRFHLVDPDQAAFRQPHFASDGTSIATPTLPALTRHWSTLQDEGACADIGEHSLLCVFWPDLSGYDVAGVASLQPPMFLSMADAFGAAGSHPWHYMLGARWKGRNTTPPAPADEVKAQALADMYAKIDDVFANVRPYTEVFYCEMLQRCQVPKTDAIIVHGILWNLFVREDVRPKVRPEWLEHMVAQCYVSPNMAGWTREKALINNSSLDDEVSARLEALTYASPQAAAAAICKKPAHQVTPTSS
jgi:hypothetical protein